MFLERYFSFIDINTKTNISASYHININKTEMFLKTPFITAIMFSRIEKEFHTEGYDNKEF